MPTNNYTVTGADGLPATEEMGVLTEGIGFNLRPVIDQAAAAATAAYINELEAALVALEARVSALDGG